MRECYFADFSIGPDAFLNIEKVCSNIGNNVLIIGGETALSKSIEKLRLSLEKFNIVDIVMYGKECYKTRIYEIASLYKEKKIDFIVGVGGGKAIDTSKCVADTLGIPVVTVPTISSNCASTSALAVVYNENHTFECFWNFKRPAYHCFIDTEIIAEAPYKYFRAGIGDTVAKYYEVEFSMRGQNLSFNDEMGLSISRMCSKPLIDNAVKAFNDCKNNIISEEFESVAKIILVSTGMVSMLIDGKFNGALAHGLFYGLTVIEGFEEKFLHGDVIGYTTVVQLIMDGKTDEAIKIRNLIKSLGVETTLKERGIDTSRENLQKVITSALNDPDMEVIPYQVTPDMVYDAIIKTESL